VPFALGLLVIAIAAAQAEDNSSTENTVLLRQIKQRALADLGSVPNYVCFDSIERSLWIPDIRQFRRLDRLHLEVAHIEGADRFSWLGNSAFQSKAPTAMVGYGASFRGDFADNRALVLANRWTKISYAGRVTIEGRPALRYEYDVHRGVLAVSNASQSGFAAARGAFWIDPATLDVLQIDLEAYDIPPGLKIGSIVDRTMYWPVLVGGQRVLLARGSELLLTESDGTVKKNASVFSNCREYTAESTVTFGPSPSAPVSPPAAEDTRVQPGLELQLVLDSPLDANKAAIGDPIRAHVLESAGGVRRGTHVHGRVTRIINYNDQIPTSSTERSSRPSKQATYGQHAGEVLIGIEFSQIESIRSRVPFLARLIDVELQQGSRETPVRGFGYFEDGATVQYDPPATASFYVSQENPVLGRGVIMRWVTLPGRGPL
jgi:hypothetical protein